MTSDSEDLLWCVKLPPPGGDYQPGADSRWRELNLDAGWYRGVFRGVLLDPDRDHVMASFTTPLLSELVVCIENWLLHAPLGDLLHRGEDTRK